MVVPHKDPPRSHVIRWTIAGAAFGLLFLLAAWWLAVAESGQLAFGELHEAHPTMWVVDLAPAVLAILGAVIGALYARLARSKARTEATARQIATSWTAELHTANVELAQRLETRRRFHAAATHELRTPLATIVGFTGLAEDVASEPPELSGYLSEIYGAATAMLVMVNDLLDAAKLEEGGIPIEISLVSCEDAIEDVAVRLMPLARHKGLAISTDVEEGMECRADPLRLRQVLTNVVANAIKYSDSGTISISAFQQMDGSSVVAVKDQGIGIAPEDLDWIFDTFESGANGVTHGSSSGLGLAISTSLMRAMDGGISVQSGGAGHGSTFRLSLRPPTQQAAEQRTASLVPRAGAE
ncbi:sensor histidine kinase [Actinomycetota bacterium]